MDMDISMDIHEKSVDMDMDVIFHIHGNPRREDRGTAGAEGDGVRGGVSPPHWGEVSGGAMPPPEKKISIFDLKMARL